MKIFEKIKEMTLWGVKVYIIAGLLVLSFVLSMLLNSLPFMNIMEEASSKIQAEPIYKSTLEDLFDQAERYTTLGKYQIAIRRYSLILEKHLYQEIKGLDCRVIDIVPYHMAMAYYSLNDFKNAALYFRKATYSRLPQVKVRSYIDLARSYMNMQDYKSVILVVTRFLRERMPVSKMDRAYAYRLMGDAHKNLLEYDKAIQTYHKAMEDNKYYAEALYGQIAYCYWQMGELKEAYNHYIKARSYIIIFEGQRLPAYDGELTKLRKELQEQGIWPFGKYYEKG